jgi:pseudaminic acid synthase
MNENIIIKDRVIGNHQSPFLIAEMSGNHNQSIDRALALVDAAAAAGAHAIKLQTYTADTMTIPHNKGLFKIDDPTSLWNGKTLYELYEIAHTPWEWHQQIFDRALEKGIIAFSTPFDSSSVDFLEELNVPLYKIASFENKDWPLLKKIAQTGKPIIMSTGATSLSELGESVSILRENGCKTLVLLQCTSTYPSSASNSNLRTIPHLKEMFKCHTGLSDHTLGVGASIASVALGAAVIEKHFTLSREDGGVDAAFSMEPVEFKQLVNECETAYLSLGSPNYSILKDENSSLRFKRSIYVVEDIKSGEEFTSTNTRIIRPGDGLAPKYFDKVLGRVAKKNINRGTPLDWDLV